MSESTILLGLPVFDCLRLCARGPAKWGTRQRNWQPDHAGSWFSNLRWRRVLPVADTLFELRQIAQVVCIVMAACFSATHISTLPLL
jgi:hypothetical protein